MVAVLAMVACETSAFLLAPGSALPRHTPVLKAASSRVRFSPAPGAGLLRTNMNTAGTATLVRPEEAKLALSYFLKDEGATITATTGGVSLLEP